MLWMVHPNRGNSGLGDVGPGNNLSSYPSFQSKKGIVPSRNEEDYSEEYDDGSPSLDFAFNSTKTVNDSKNNASSFTLEEFRLETQKFMASSSFGQIYFNFFLIMSVFSCGQYIYQTYPQDVVVRFCLTIIEIVLAAMFFFDWCLSLFLAEQRWDHFWSFFALVDFATVVPTLLVNIFFEHSVSYHDIKNFHDAMNYLVHGAYTLRILRALRLQKKLNLITDEVDRFLYSMLLSIITMVLFDSAVMQYLEAHTQKLPFHTWMYYTVVTICTVGYGDISPQSGLGKLFCVMVILFAVVYLPQQTNELIDKMNIFSVYARRKYVPIGQAKHVVICGDLRTTFLEEFFGELFHEDHENMNLNAVVLQPESPSPEMHAILRDTNFGIVVHYLAGSPLNNHDLVRARIDIAVAVFIMGNKFSIKPDEDDAKTILQYFSIQRYLRTQAHHDPLYCMQLIRPENKRHLGKTVTDEDRQEIIICLNEMKMGLIAKTCMYPGTSTLIFNLLTSFADTGDEIEEDDETILKLMEESGLEMTDPGKKLDKLEENSDEEGSDDDKKMNPINLLRRVSREASHIAHQILNVPSKESADQNNSDSDSECTVRGGYWMNEYQKGCDWEIYTTEMADKFEGIKFIDLARTLYVKLGVVLFGLRVTDLNLVTNRVRVILNPADYIIPPKTRCLVEGFVLAKNQAAANLSFNGGASFDQSSHLETIANSLIKLKPTNAPGMRKRNSITGRSPIVPTAPKTGIGWNVLFGARANAIQQEEMHQSRQEREQKLELDHLRNNFFIRDRQAELSECTIKTSLAEEYPFIRDHMIVITKGLSNLYDFIRPLRAKYLGKLKHIVILFPFDITENIWRKLSQFEGILYVRGSPLEENDIKRAGIFRAAQVVVLADPDIAAESDGSLSVNALIDADAIFTYNCVKRLNEKAQIVIEVIQQQNISYLESKSSDIDYKFTPNFACGMLFTSSMLDAVVCQAFYNPQIIRVLYKLISGTDHLPEKGNEKAFLSEKSQSRGLGLKGISGSSLYQIPVPAGFHMKTYGQLFDFYAKEDCICIALLRGLDDGTTVGPCLNRLPYVFTNPPIATVVYRWDKVFLLSQRVLTSTKASIKEVLETFAHANNCVTLKRNIDLEEHTAHQDINEIATTQRTLEKAISALTVDVSNRFDDLIVKQKSINETLGVLPKQETTEVLDGATTTNVTVHKAIERMGSRTALSRTSSSTSSSRPVVVDRSNSRSVRIKEEIKRRKSVVTSHSKSDLSQLQTHGSNSSLPISNPSTNPPSPERLINHAASSTQSTCSSPTQGIAIDHRSSTPVQIIQELNNPNEINDDDSLS